MTVASALSWLFVPGDRPALFTKAAASGADMTIIDLQDAVAPIAKAAARRATHDWLDGGGTACVRINPLATPDGVADLAMLADLAARSGEWAGRSDALQGVMLPLAAEISELDQLGAALSSTPVVVLIETARGLIRLRELCEHPVTARVAFGNLDMSADLGCLPSSAVIASARTAIVVESRGADLPAPVDGVTPSFAELETTKRDAATARCDGFGGKLCIHPSQVEVVRNAYRPSQEELLWAARVEEAMRSGCEGVVALDGAMLDAPVLRRARDTLARAEVRADQASA